MATNTTYEDITSASGCEAACACSSNCTAYTYSGDEGDCYLMSACYFPYLASNATTLGLKQPENSSTGGDAAAAQQGATDGSGWKDGGEGMMMSADWNNNDADSAGGGMMDRNNAEYYGGG
eukprot:scaffold353561_cov45-Prasinocladus_malaysianus.AAC.1